MAPVQLYVYDLSNGLARSLSFQLTGKQIDGIWHTSVVVFGKEIYYGPYNAGPGIQVTAPGQSHHGRPLKVENMGETALDEATFWEYVNEVQEQYTGEKYHLLDFNCNSFTNDCVGFLTGGTIPTWIKDLPTDFLSTPFGQSMRPTIDNMFRRPLPTTGGPTPAVASLSPIAAASNAATLTSPVHIASNTASFNSILISHKIVVAFFTSDTCPPCKMIAPVFSDLAYQKSRTGVAFVEVNFSTGMSGMIAKEYGISATPTFLFFLNGKKSSELKGVNAPELKSQVDLLFFEAFPPHPHTKLDLPTIRKTSLDPILYTQPPSYDALLAKIISFINASTSTADKSILKNTLSTTVLPYLKDRFPAKADPSKQAIPVLPTHLPGAFASASNSLLNSLPPSEIFPIVDLWRVAVLDDKIAAWLALSSNRDNDITTLVIQHLHALSDPPRNLLLTTLRLASNCFASPGLTRHILNPSSPSRRLLTSILIPALLHDDSAVRTAAGSLAFNVATYVQKPLMDAARNGEPTPEADGGSSNAEWEIEMVSALVEGLRREEKSEEVVHRLVAALAFMVHLSPDSEDAIAPLLEVLQAKEVLEVKIGKGGGVYKEDVRKLIKEVALLCG